MKITKEDVEHLAKLARLQLSDDEKSKYSLNLGEVLTYVDKLREFNAPTTHEVDLLNDAVLRSDQVDNWPKPLGLVLLAPEQHDGLIEVPAVFEKKE